MKIGDKVHTTILDIAHGGHCIARVDGQVIFVRHAIPGEEGIVEITSQNSKIYRGDLIEVTKPSDKRIKPLCNYAKPDLCGGCAFAHIDLNHETELKKKVLIDQFAKIGKIDISHMDIQSPGYSIGEGNHWRRRMNFAVTPNKKLGLHSSRSNKVLEINHCYIASDVINTAAFPSDSEVQKEQITTLSQVKDFSVPLEFSESNNNELAISYRGKVFNGVEEIHESVGGINYEVSPHSFWQSHDQAARVLVERVNALVKIRNGDTVLDLYSGVGLFGGQLLNQVGTTGKVIFIESDSHSGRDCIKNFSSNKSAVIKLGRVENILSSIKKADVIVLDPPRAGADKKVIVAIHRLMPRQILYISCDPATLARDIASVMENDQYSISEISMYNLYPRTHHLESVVLLERTK